MDDQVQALNERVSWRNVLFAGWCAANSFVTGINLFILWVM